MTIYVDCDGVLADFDSAATELFGEDPRAFEEREGSDHFWRAIREKGDFFLTLGLLPDATRLMSFLRPFNPIILTGCPSQIPEGHFQKQEWVKATFGPSQPVITCQSKLKSNFCRPGDIIVDDYPKHIEAWESKGGIWVLHKTYDETVVELSKIFAKRLGYST